MSDTSELPNRTTDHDPDLIAAFADQLADRLNDLAHTISTVHSELAPGPELQRFQPTAAQDSAAATAGATAITIDDVLIAMTGAAEHLAHAHQLLITARLGAVAIGSVAP